MIQAFHQPKTLDEACAILAQYGASAVPVAGGTDVMVDLRAGKARYADAAHLVDVTRVTGLDRLEQHGNALFIGAGVTHATLAASPLILEHIPFLAAACGSVGSPQIRNRATIGGNLMTASPAADGVIPLFALDAVAVLRSARGERELPMADLLAKAYCTTREPDELLVGFRLTLPEPGTRTVFLKIGRRKSLAIARMNVAVTLRTEGKRIAAVSIVPGAVLSTARRLSTVEAYLLGKEATPEVIQEAGRLAAEAMIEATGRRWSTPYKEPVLAALVRRAIRTALEVEDVR